MLNQSRVVPNGSARCRPKPAPLCPPFLWAHDGARPYIIVVWDDMGRRRDVHQGEGCEQGYLLAPALYAIGQHAALLAAHGRLQADEEVSAFLDDLYVLTTLPRARVARDVVAGACGIASNHGKTRMIELSSCKAARKFQFHSLSCQCQAVAAKFG